MDPTASSIQFLCADTQSSSLRLRPVGGASGADASPNPAGVAGAASAGRCRTLTWATPGAMSWGPGGGGGIVAVACSGGGATAGPAAAASCACGTGGSSGGNSAVHLPSALQAPSKH